MGMKKIQQMLIIFSIIFFNDSFALSSKNNGTHAINGISKIIIKSQSAKSFYEDANCQNLIIDEKRIRFFLKNQQIDNQYNFRKSLLTEDCYAEGIILFKDGRRNQIILINWAGWGSLTQGKETRFMRCDLCENILEPDFSFNEK